MKNNSHTHVGDSIRQAGHRLDEFGETTASKTDELIHKGQRAAMDLKKEAEVYSETTVDYIRKNPIKATLIATGIGILLSRILK